MTLSEYIDLLKQYPADLPVKRWTEIDDSLEEPVSPIVHDDYVVDNRDGSLRFTVPEVRGSYQLKVVVL